MNQDIKGIVTPEGIFNQAKKYFESSKLESTVFFFGKEKDGKLLVTDIVMPNETDYEKRTFGHVHVKDEFIASTFAKFIAQNKLLVASSHSQSIEEPSFGDIDTHLRVIRFHPRQLTGIFYAGRLTFYQYNKGMQQVPHTTYSANNFDRQVRFLGEAGQLLLSTTTACVIGVGGGNSKIALDLAALGISRLILIDPDKWEETNRNRALIPPDHVGMYKSESVQQIIKEYYPHTETVALVAKAEHVSEKFYKQADLFIVGPDGITPRIFGNRVALEHNKPAVFPAAGIDVKDSRLHVMGGSVQAVIPRQTPCYECINTINSTDIDRETMDLATKKKLSEKYGVSLDIPTTPSIVSLNDVIAGATIWEIVKIVTQIDRPTPFQVYDALKTELKAVAVTKNPKCPACGEVEDTKDLSVETKSPEELLSAVKE